MPIITLTTDFGTRDGYVGAVKGVILRLAPDATVVDIAHDIPRGDIAHAAWVLATSTLEFPHDTVHVVVVDPGVGTSRPAVIARVPAYTPRGAQIYVGPDNGVFAHLPIDKAWTIKEHEVPGTPSATFHGRDLFAPAAALLATGRLEICGPETTLSGALPWPGRSPGAGRIVHIDHYGNAITDLPGRQAIGTVRVMGKTLPLVRTYADVPSGELLAYVGSAKTVEIAVRDGSAAQRLQLERGMVVEADPRHEGGPYR